MFSERRKSVLFQRNAHFCTYAASPFSVQVIPAATANGVSPTRVRAHRVKTHLTRLTRSGYAQTLIYICEGTKQQITRKNTNRTQTQKSVIFMTDWPMQLPRASWMNPVPHCSMGRHRNDPNVFRHSSPVAQLWEPNSHSSMSEQHSTKQEHTMMHVYNQPLTRGVCR